MKKLEYTAIGGEFSFTSSALIGKTILSVQKDGVGYSRIVTTTPTDKQVQYINSTGQIGFFTALTPFEPVVVLYQDNGDVCFPVALQSGQLPDANAGEAYNASFFISGTGPYSIGSIVKPLWMTVTLTSNQVVFSGTPAILDSGENSVSFTLSNTCGSVNFSQSLNVVVADAEFGATTFVSGDRLTDVEVANLTGVSGVVATVTLDSLINTNGGVLKVNGVTAAEGNTYNVTLKGSLNVEIDGVTNPGTVIKGHFTITSVSAGGIGVSKTYQISKVF